MRDQSHAIACCIALLALIIGSVDVRGQSSGPTKEDAALEAVRFLKSSLKALAWNEGFYRAAAPEVIAAGPRLRLEESGQGVAARIRSDAQLAGFRLAAANWACQRSEYEMERARCALDGGAAYYVDVGEPGVRSDSAWMLVYVFVKDSRMLTGIKRWDSVVWLARDGERWRGARIVRVLR